MHITSTTKWQFILALVIFVPTSILGAYLFGMMDSIKPISPNIEALRLLGGIIILPVIALKESGVMSNAIIIWPTIIVAELVWMFLLIKVSYDAWLIYKRIITHEMREKGVAANNWVQTLTALLLAHMAFGVGGYLIGREEKQLSQEEFKEYADDRLFEFMCETNYSSYKRISEILDKTSEGVTFSDDARKLAFNVLKNTVREEYLLYENECPNKYLTSE